MLAKNTGIVDQDVDPPEDGADFLPKTPHLIGRRHVSGETSVFLSGQRCERGFGRLLIGIEMCCDPASPGGELLGDRPANASRGPGNESDRLR